MHKTAIAKVAENLSDIPQLFVPLKLIVFEFASLCGLIYWLWKHVQ